MNELTEAALGYLEQGHHLLALSGKRPNLRYHSKGDGDEVGWSWDRSIHGSPETDEDRAALAEVFEHPSTTGVAILIPKGVLVADVDTDEAADLFLAAGGTLDTVCAKTTKGYHVWFEDPAADKSVWLGGRVLLFKGFGGYVAAPPSRHFADEARTQQDGVYTWLVEPAGQRLAPLPAQIADRLKIVRSFPEPVREERAGPSLHVPLDAEFHWTWNGWAEWNIEGLRQAIIKAPDGNQNNMIAWAAMQARDEGVPYDAAMPALLSAALEGHHPRQRAIQTIRGAYGRRSRG